MNFLKIDKAWVGFLMGLVFPALGFLFLNLLSDFLKGKVLPSYAGFSLKFLIVMSVCCNLLPFAVARKQRLDHQMQGIVGATLFLAMLYFVWMIYKEF